MAESKPHYLKHRQRLRKRLMEDGPDSLRDYEVLELVLFHANARQDMKPVAKDLIDRFGSFAEVISADPDRLKETKGVKDATVAVLKTVQAAALHLTKDEIKEKPVIGSWDKLMAYLRARMAFETTEQFRVLFLNNKNVLIREEEQQRGTVDHTPIYPREIVKRTLELGATALILVHNHPSGDPTPSRADIDMTREIKETAEKLGITLHDHVIIGRNGHCSLKSLGLL